MQIIIIGKNAVSAGKSCGPRTAGADRRAMSGCAHRKAGGDERPARVLLPDMFSAWPQRERCTCASCRAMLRKTAVSSPLLASYEPMEAQSRSMLRVAASRTSKVTVMISA